MPIEYDVVVDAPDRTRVLVVECMQMMVTSSVEAADLRRRFRAFGRNLRADYYMLAFPSGLFLWKEEGAAADTLPQFNAALMPALRPYLGDLADKPGGPLSGCLQLAVSSWLNDLMWGIRQPDPDSEPEQVVVQSGLLERIKGGVVRMDAAA